MSKQLYCGDFPELQSHFITSVTALRRQGPLEPMTVLVTGQLIRLSLKRELARSGCSHANISFLTLNELAQRLTQNHREENSFQLLPEITRDLLMKKAVDMVSAEIKYFSRLKQREGFRRALWGTLDELRGAKVTPVQLAALAKSSQLNSNPILKQKLLELSTIWASLQSLMDEYKLQDRISVVEIAIAECVEFDQPLIIYGLDELTAIEFELLAALIKNTLVRAYLPCKFDNHDLEIISEPYLWVDPVYRWYRLQSFALFALESAQNSSNSVLHTIQKNLFLEAVNIKVENHRDNSFLLISAPGESRETEELTRQLLNSNDENTSSNKRAILIRQNEPFNKLLRDQFENLGIVGYFHECQTLGETTAGKALRRFAYLLDGTFQRESVMEFILLSPLKIPKYFPPELPSVPAVEWNQFTYRTGITNSVEKWKEGFVKLKTTISNQINRCKKQVEDNAIIIELERELISLTYFEQYILALSDSLLKIASTKSWYDCVQQFWQDFLQIVEVNSVESQAIQRELESIADSDKFRIEFGLPQFAQLIESLLQMPVSREGKFERHEPAVATVKQAKGVLFDEIYLPGLKEKGFPQSVSQDPILLDEERIQISSYLSDHTQAGFIPVRGRLSLQETYLYRTAVSCARKKVVLSFSRLDLGKSRELLPSQFVLKTIAAINGESVNYETLNNYIHNSPQGYFVPLGRLVKANTKTSISELNYNSAIISVALVSKSGKSLAYLHNRNFFIRGIASEKAKFGRKEFTKYEGRIESKELSRRLVEWNLKYLLSLSPSRLETYATCPFQYFGKYVLELQKLEEPEEIKQIDSLQRGNLVHGILEKFYQTKRPYTWEILEQTAQTSFAAFEKKEITGLLVLWQNQKRQILKGLKRYFELEIIPTDESIPAYFEQSFGIENDKPNDGLNHNALTLELDDKSQIHFRGIIDRIDLNSKNEAQVIDYKTGRKRSYIKDGDLSEGRALQLPIYRLAAEQLLGKKVTQALYYYIFSDHAKNKYRFTEEHWKKQAEEFMALVSGIIQGIRIGKYFPTPDENNQCKHCEVRTACGHGRFTQKKFMHSERKKDG